MLSLQALCIENLILNKKFKELEFYRQKNIDFTTLEIIEKKDPIKILNLYNNINYNF